MNVEREHAFSESDVRLLQTLANSMSVALENARLFDETQRLLKETEQRNAELAIINSVQAALAAELNIQGIYDTVGDKIRDVFGDTDMSIRIYDPRTDLVHYPYIYEDGTRITSTRIRWASAASPRTSCVPASRWSSTTTWQRPLVRYGSSVAPGTRMAKSAIYVPLVVGDQVRGLLA